METRIETNKEAAFRITKVSGYMTELVELHSAAPLLYVLFIPGNPGVIPFYKDFIQSLYKILDEKASVIGIGHIGHTKKNWENGRLFSLEDQINHKISFMKQELQSTRTPIVLVGHSIGAYIALEVFRRLPQQVAYVVDLFPFLAIDRKSSEQRKVDTITRISPLCSFLSLIVAVLGVFPSCIKNIVIKEGMGKLWSSSAVGATRSHLLKYHMIRNLFHMAMTEFDDLKEEPDWTFIKEKQKQISFLFGMDDHWGPLGLFEEISKRVPGVPLTIESEGHVHAFCCTEAGSDCVAQFVANTIKQQNLIS